MGGAELGRHLPLVGQRIDGHDVDAIDAAYRTAQDGHGPTFIVARTEKDLKAVAPYDPGRPCEIEIEFISPDRLMEYRNRRGVEQRDAMTLVSRADDWWTAWSQFFF